MIARDFINDLIPNLRKSDTAQQALDWMGEFLIKQLPLVEHGKYLGMVTMRNLELIPQPEQLTLENILLEYEKIKVSSENHLFEMLATESDDYLDILPVFSIDEKFIGSVNIRDVALEFARKVSTTDPGGIFVLAVSAIDYSLQEIGRLVESNQAKVLSSFVENDPRDPSKLIVTLKINVLDLTHILATFQRFNYQILAKFDAAEPQHEDNHRLDLLFKYLEI